MNNIHTPHGYLEVTPLPHKTGWDCYYQGNFIGKVVLNPKDFYRRWEVIVTGEGNPCWVVDKGKAFEMIAEIGQERFGKGG